MYEENLFNAIDIQDYIKSSYKDSNFSISIVYKHKSLSGIPQNKEMVYVLKNMLSKDGNILEIKNEEDKRIFENIFDISTSIGETYEVIHVGLFLSLFS